MALVSKIVLRCLLGLSAGPYILVSVPALPQHSSDQNANAVLGRQLFNNACRLCHTTNQDDNRQGPNLHHVIGRRAGSLSNYAYSTSMKTAGFIWHEPTIERFI